MFRYCKYILNKQEKFTTRVIDTIRSNKMIKNKQQQLMNQIKKIDHDDLTKNPFSIK